LAILFGLILPSYEGPDEVDHILYVKHIAEGLGIPVQSRDYAIAYGFGQEGSQAPLYYALNAGLVRALGLSLADLEVTPPPNPFTVCGRPAGRHNVAGYRHDPRDETFPYRGAARAVHVMRLASALLGAATVATVFVSARMAFPGQRVVAPLASLLVAFNPQFVFMGAVVNNDGLVNFLLAVVVAFTLYCIQRGFTRRRAALLGVLCGLAPLAKLGGLLGAAFAGMGFLMAAREHLRADRRAVLAWLSQVALAAAAFVAVAGWWFVRNWVLYGDVTGMNAMLSVYGGRGGWPAELVLPELVDTFRSYWGSFACGLRLPLWTYWLFAALSALAAVGWAVAWRRTSGRVRLLSALLSVWFAVVLALWVRWNQITFAPLGRLLFQANAAVAPLMAYGIAGLTRRPRWVAAGVGLLLASFTLVGMFGIVAPAYALPDRYPTARAPEPDHPLANARFGDEIAVLGYGVSATTVEPGASLEVDLHLRALQPISQDYTLALQLVSPVPGDQSVLVNYNTFPGSGSYGTAVWQTDEVVVDSHTLRIPQAVSRTQAWRLLAVFYRPSDGGRLPVAVGGQPSGDALGLGLFRVGASARRDVPPGARLDLEPSFGQLFALRGAEVRAPGDGDGSESGVRVVLWWEALASPTTDYSVFVHLLDGDGALVATGDGAPLDGGFPTSLWLPGDRAKDVHDIPVPEALPAGAYSVEIGWYEPESGARLDATLDGTVLDLGAFPAGGWDGR
jgi:hypothetical protein